MRSIRNVSYKRIRSIIIDDILYGMFLHDVRWHLWLLTNFLHNIFRYSKLLIRFHPIEMDDAFFSFLLVIIKHYREEYMKCKNPIGVKEMERCIFLIERILSWELVIVDIEKEIGLPQNYSPKISFDTRLEFISSSGVKKCPYKILHDTPVLEEKYNRMMRETFTRQQKYYIELFDILKGKHPFHKDYYKRDGVSHWGWD